MSRAGGDKPLMHTVLALAYAAWRPSFYHYEWHVDRATLDAIAAEDGSAISELPEEFGIDLHLVGLPVVIAPADEPGIALRRRTTGAHEATS